MSAAERTARGWPGLDLLARLPAWSRFVLVTLAVLVCGVVASRPATAAKDEPLTGDAATAAAAVDALRHPSAADPLAAFPADFDAVMGRSPSAVPAGDGTLRAADPSGDCSGPAGATSWDFDLACKSHDLGYDLLRYAEIKGQPLPQSARRELDTRLELDMHDRCRANPRGSESQCHAVASVYAAGLEFNSWRQRWSAPGHEPVLAWGFGSAVVVLLLLARVPGARARRGGGPGEGDGGPEAARPAPLPASPDRYATFLRLASLGLVVAGQSLLTLSRWSGFGAPWLWVAAWVLQAVPVFFFAGGHANLLAWQAVRADHGGYGRYLTGRLTWLLRPVLAFVLAWLVLPLPLQLLDVPEDGVELFGRLIAQPLWFVGVYLVAVAATPLMAALHRRARLLTPFALVALMAVVDAVRVAHEWRTGGYATLVLGALLLQQLGFCYADGSLARVRRSAYAGLALVSAPALAALLALGGHPGAAVALPGDDVEGAGSPTVLLLVLALGQLCLVMLLRERATAWLADGTPWRVVHYARTAPMTLYLGYLTALAAVVGSLGLLDSPSTAVTWLLTSGVPRWPALLVLLLLPLLRAFHRFERHQALPLCRTRETHRTRLAVTLGVGYGALGVVGFVVTGFAGQAGSLGGLQVDALQNLIHLLLGWYLVHVARSGACHDRGPWLLTALACVPPMLVLEPTSSVLALHGATIAVALLACAAKQDQQRAPEHWQPREALHHP
ncbi:phospholipase A2 [Actinosynnema sp.]|uniref:phospholipase A2 n=1 Tax=Actinosynnema sp. TaxID=1872144 RepID=UPI003F85C9FE